MKKSDHNTIPMELIHCCPLTTASALKRAVTIAPDVEAVVGAIDRLTFEQLDHDVSCITQSLWSLGVRHGDHIGICAGNSARWVALFLAIGNLGAIAVPVNTRLKATEIAYTLRQAKVKFLFIVDRFLKIDFVQILRGICPAVDTALPDPALPDLNLVVFMGDERHPPGTICWTEFITRKTFELPAQACAADDILLIQYTSGTTAAPKGVMLTHRNMLANGFFTGARLGLRPGDRFHSARPFFHVAGTSQSILACLQHATTLVTMDRFEPDKALLLMEREKCTHFSANDTMSLMLLDHPDRPKRKLKLRGAWLAASSPIAERVVNELGAPEAVLAYGQSEASPNIAISCWWEPLHLRLGGRMQPQPGVSVRICDKEGVPCGPEMKGEIQVRGWNVMRGYYEMPDATKAVLSEDGWLSTGDLGLLGADGRLAFIGRCKEMIRVGGENVAPADIEQVLQQHPAICQAQIVGVPHPRLIEVPAAFVVLRPDAHVSAEELLKWCKTELASFKVPRYLEIIDDFEKIGTTASAKVRKSDLRDHAIRLFKLEDQKEKPGQMPNNS